MPVSTQAQVLHLPTSRDAFLHVQYNTAGALADALSKDAPARKAIAKHFGVSEASLLDYIRKNLVLTTTKETIKVPNYGLTAKGYMYYKLSTFKPGLKVWATRDGKPVLKWICTNPITFKLPVAPPEVAKAAPKPVQKPKPVVRIDTPPPPPPVVEKVVEKPKPVVVVEKPIEKPVIPPPPPPPVVEKVVETPKPVVEKPKPIEQPKPAIEQPKPVTRLPLVEPCALLARGPQTRFNFMYGKLSYNQPVYDKFTAKNQTGFFGASVDILKSPRTATSLYFDYSRNTHSTVCTESLGYGIEKRVYLHCVDRITRPYYGAGVGNYRTLYLAHLSESIGRPTGIGGKVFLGFDNHNTFVELGNQLFGELKTLDKLNKVKLNNTYLGVGIRF